MVPYRGVQNKGQPRVSLIEDGRHSISHHDRVVACPYFRETLQIV